MKIELTSKSRTPKQKSIKTKDAIVLLHLKSRSTPIVIAEGSLAFTVFEALKKEGVEQIKKC